MEWSGLSDIGSEEVLPGCLAISESGKENGCLEGGGIEEMRVKLE